MRSSVSVSGSQGAVRGKTLAENSENEVTAGIGGFATLKHSSGSCVIDAWGDSVLPRAVDASVGASAFPHIAASEPHPFARGGHSGVPGSD